MSEVDERIERIIQFKENLIAWEESRNDKLREWLNQNVHWVSREAVEAGCFKRDEHSSSNGVPRWLGMDCPQRS